MTNTFTSTFFQSGFLITLYYTDNELVINKKSPFVKGL